MVDPSVNDPSVNAKLAVGNSAQEAIAVQIIPVTTPAEQSWFLDVPAIVYANDPNWVPPLRSSIAKQLAPTNPFFQYGRLQQFIAVRREERGERSQQSKPSLLDALWRQ